VKKLLLLWLLSVGAAYPASVQIIGGYTSGQTVISIPTAQMTLVPAVTPGVARGMTIAS
jgi:hypothetical protein